MDPEQELDVDRNAVLVSAEADLDISLLQVGCYSAGGPGRALARSGEFALEEDDISTTGGQAWLRPSVGRVLLTQLQVGLNLILDWVTYPGSRLAKAIRDILQLTPSSGGSSEDGSLAGGTELRGAF